MNKNAFKKILLIFISLIVIMVFIIPVFNSDGDGFASCSNLSSYAKSFDDKAVLAGHHKVSTNNKCESCHVNKSNSFDILGAIISSCPSESEIPEITRDNCLACHNDQSKVKEVFSITTDRIKFVDGDKVYKMHDNHTGEEECSTCHKGHGKSNIICAECHNAKWIMDLKKKGWTAS
ncbi:cytochrome c3 family protein [Shewanella sp. 1180_01]|uniref:cytochrome c3 family protein n=1 Tax=Shewanella sp. 1180_01 TaxID=2604451 RepID=UPI004064C4D2